MSMIKLILLVLILSTTVIDGRARRKRRQLIPNIVGPGVPSMLPFGYNTAPNNMAPFIGPNVNPFPSGFNPPYPLNNNYPYNSYGYYPQSSYLTNSKYDVPPSLSSNTVSNPYMFYGLNNYLYWYGPQGVNTRFPNVGQGNYNHYYTGGAADQWYNNYGEGSQSDNAASINTVPFVNQPILRRSGPTNK